MKKLLKIVVACCILLSMVWLGTVIGDKEELKNNLVRFHVVANSDSDRDQAVKLRVRDAVIQKLQAVMEKMPDVKDAKTYLQENLAKIQELANEVLAREGSKDRAVVTLEKEPFPRRQYDTFVLPSGVYESLRITIGKGEGHNWWCVVFPTLCMSATTEGFQDTAAGAGFSEQLAGSLAGEEKYSLHFFLMDCLGWWENHFFA